MDRGIVVALNRGEHHSIATAMKISLGEGTHVDLEWRDVFNIILDVFSEDYAGLSDIAKRLNVHPSTITRVNTGGIKRSKAIFASHVYSAIFDPKNHKPRSESDLYLDLLEAIDSYRFGDFTPDRNVTRYINGTYEALAMKMLRKAEMASLMSEEGEFSADSGSQSTKQTLREAVNEMSSHLQLLTQMIGSIAKMPQKPAHEESEQYKSYDGGSYEGNLLNGKRHGQGKYIWPDGSSHIGEWANDVPNGYGVRNYSNGDKYEGSWADNKRKGFGTFMWKDGLTYVGNWDGERNGNGKQTDTDGGSYEGGWKNGIFHGHGRIHFANGLLLSSFECEWDDGEPHGNGVSVYSDGSVLEGQWVSGKQNGRGIKKTTDGIIFECEYVDGIEVGSGKIIEPDGSIFKGVWSKNRISGTWINTDGTTEHYEFEDKGDILRQLFSYDDGYWKEITEPASGGNVKVVYSTGEVYEGDLGWLDDECACGKLTYPDGTIYDGEWDNGIWHGKGKLTKPNKEPVEGVWENGKFMGFLEAEQRNE